MKEIKAYIKPVLREYSLARVIAMTVAKRS